MGERLERPTLSLLIGCLVLLTWAVVNLQAEEHIVLLDPTIEQPEPQDPITKQPMQILDPIAKQPIEPVDVITQPKQPIEPVDVITQPNDNFDKTLFQQVEVTPEVQAKKDAILESIVSASLSTIERNIQAADDLDKAFFDKGIDKIGVSSTDAFGPHLLTSPQAIKIAISGKIFTGISKLAAEILNISEQNIERQLSRPVPILTELCNFSFLPDCTLAATSRYRTIDGSCNNLNNRLWGRSFTPFERMMPALYDSFDQPRQTSVFNGPLPLARTISSQFHAQSVLGDLMPDLSHMSMEFGQFLSHDIQRNALSTGYQGSNIDCCQPNRGDPCFPIEIPSDDPYYSQFNRTCMNFVRALPTPNLDCTMGQRQQLNQNTHYIDGSQIYGSDVATSNSLRTFVGGKLQTGADPNIPNLLPKDLNNNANCHLPSANSNVKCFLAGDVRANQQPALISLHTIFMREHNRIAEGLSALNNGWSDQILFDEARKIVGAILQHITYKEFLQAILGDTIMISYGLKPSTSGYFNGYASSVNPAIKNEFSTAAFRFGHSMVHDSLKYSGTSHLFKDVFLKPDLVYDLSGGVDTITKGLTDSYSQKVDERLSHQLTRHLFEQQPGFGGDLAAINIQRGRDHGIPFYMLLKTICNVDDNVHSPTVWNALNALYQTEFDIDLFSGGVSENSVAGGKVGPTFACIIAKQFQALKKGDRYFYENSGNQAFSPAQLDEIRKTTLSKVICRNTGITSIPSNSFVKDTGPSNPMMSCNGVSDIDYNQWKCGWSNWGPWTICVNSIRFRLRTCRQQKPCDANVCIGNAFQVQMCRTFIDADTSKIEALIQRFESVLAGQHKNDGVVDINTAQKALQKLSSQDIIKKNELDTNLVE
ncbi:hypothetical protein ACJMK2_026215 [Sinanodonta woodiana]|uniref:Peroxidase n=1 Tax=Sinanodonta woodiana TaxID=1069815 RepID=A0ABD3XIW7_SINWO